jgi:hypothetical protein
MKSLTAGLICVGCLLVAGSASAHFTLDFPMGRSGEIDSKPCGGSGSKRGNTVTTFKPGDTVTLKWNVQVAHTTPGLWRISIDDSGQDFPEPVTANDTSKLPLFLDHVEASGEKPQETSITIPDIECDNCTLQMLQYKYAQPPYTDPSSFYYQCADIVISSSAEPTPPNGGSSAQAGSGTGSGTAGSSSPTTGGGGSGAPPAKDTEDGGCSIASRRAPKGTATMWVALALLLIPRRRRRGAAPSAVA